MDRESFGSRKSFSDRASYINKRKSAKHKPQNVFGLSASILSQKFHGSLMSARKIHRSRPFPLL